MSGTCHTCGAHALETVSTEPVGPHEPHGGGPIHGTLDVRKCGNCGETEVM
jgi:hypothetical protein